MKTLSLVLAGMVVLPAATHAQSSDFEDATASIEVIPVVDAVKVADLDFGQHPASAGQIRSSDVGAAAVWNVTVENAPTVQISFTLPFQLRDANGSSVAAISFGSTSAELLDGPTGVIFDPAAGLTHSPATGVLSVVLGGDRQGDDTGDALVDITGIGAGLYTGTITMTVTIL